jgi:hypothetical protein
LNASVSYIYDRTWSLTAGRVSVSGNADAALYGTFTGSPNSAGWIFDLAYLLQIPTMSPADSEMISPGDTR